MFSWYHLVRSHLKLGMCWFKQLLEFDNRHILNSFCKVKACMKTALSTGSITTAAKANVVGLRILDLMKSVQAKERRRDKHGIFASPLMDVPFWSL